MLDHLLDLLEKRLHAKLSRAEEAYVRQHTIKTTQNCKHHGRKLSDNQRVCRLQCMGENEAAAGTCWAEKAAQCEFFQLKLSIELLRQKFNHLSEEEIRVRWPSIGEIYWLRKQLSTLEQIGTDKLKVGNKKAV